jgi:hypothetical protein
LKSVLNDLYDDKGDDDDDDEDNDAGNEDVIVDCDFDVVQS